MAGEGTISSSLCVLKTVLNIVSLYLEKLKKDLTLLSFGMESTQKPQLVGIGVGQSYHEEGNQNRGREAWRICICQKEAGITGSVTNTNLFPTTYLHTNEETGVSKETHHVCKQRQELCFSIASQPDLGFVWWRSGTAQEQEEHWEKTERQKLVWSWESQRSKTQCAYMPNGGDNILPHGAAKDQKRR